ncbi:MAG: DUF1552 domain-containing protein [Pirellulaceae bacterium]
MNSKTQDQFGRRRFLRGVGLSLAIPALESLRPGNTEAAAGDRSKARNFVCVAPDYGLNPEGFFPQQTGDQYTMPNSLQALTRHRRDFSVFSQLDHPDVGVVTAAPVRSSTASRLPTPTVTAAGCFHSTNWWLNGSVARPVFHRS